MFSRQKLTHAYYAFTSYVGCDGHLYKVFLVLVKLRLISDEMCHLYRKFMSYLRCLLCKMRLIFPHIINGLLSSYVPQILLQPVRIIARKFANPLVPHTAVHLHTFPLWYNHSQYKNTYLQFQLSTIMSIFCCKVSPPMPSSCSSSCSVSNISLCQQERYPPKFSPRSPAICPWQCAIHFDDMCPVHHCPASSEQSSFSTKFLTPI